MVKLKMSTDHWLKKYYVQLVQAGSEQSKNMIYLIFLYAFLTPPPLPGVS